MRTIKYQNIDKVNGTSLKGYMVTTYEALVNKLGNPNRGPSGDKKTDCEWVVDIDGEVCTIYNWKTGGIPEGTYRWHIGGHSSNAVKFLEEVMETPTEVFKI
jgi:hypothetical protein